MTPAPNLRTFPAMKLSPEILEKIKTNSLETFECRKGNINGLDCYLVTPCRDNSTVWTRDNIHFRSSIWSEGGELLSASFKKAPNWGENPGNFPPPESLDSCTVVEKLDGSTLIFDIINNELNIRTRGTFTYKGGDMQEEIDKVVAQLEYLQGDFVNKFGQPERYTLLYEFTSPRHKIVLDYGDKANVKLIGINDKADYSLLDQKVLDELCAEFNTDELIKVERPETYKFDKHPTLVLLEIKDWVNKEGVCVYSPDGQFYWKIKGSEYLKRHVFKENCSLKTLFELHLAATEDEDPEEILKEIERDFDWEMAQVARPYLKEVFDIKDAAREAMDLAVIVHHNICNLPRRDYAMKVKDRPYSWLFFQAYDKKGEIYTKENWAKIQQQIFKEREAAKKSEKGKTGYTDID